MVSRAAFVWLAALASAAFVAHPRSASAQATLPDAQRVSASLDYVSADGLYLGVGSDVGAVAGDTLRVFADSIAGEPLGRIVLVSVTRRRSVARPLDRTLLEAGTSVFLELHFREEDPVEAVAAAPQTPDAPSHAPSPSRSHAGARLTGRLSVDLDARETRTSWSGDLSGERVRRFASPTTRLSFVASDLPGGISVRANMRGAYRYDELTSGPRPLTVRAYELAVVRDLDAVPVQLMLGRFANPFESYSAYWDGVLIRIGSDAGPGIGVVAGFEPHLEDEGFSTALPKLTAFADYAVRAGAWRYDTDVSIHFFRPDDAFDLTSAGWSQRLTLGRLDLAQRLRLGQANGGGWSVADARVRAGLDLVGPLRLRASYGRMRTALPLASLTADTLLITPGPIREEASLGFELGGRRGAVSVDAGGTRRDGSRPGLALSTSVRWGWRAGRVSLGGHRWSGGGSEALSLAPGLEILTGPLSWRASYRFYRTDSALASFSTQAAGAEIGFAFSRALHITMGGERQWGERMSGTRVHLGVWRAF